MSTLLVVQLVHNHFQPGKACECRPVSAQTARMLGQLKSLIAAAGWNVAASGVAPKVDPETGTIQVKDTRTQVKDPPCGQGPAMKVRRGGASTLWVCPEHYRPDVDDLWTEQREAQTRAAWFRIKEPGR